MYSLPNLLLYCALFTSFLQISSAAPAAACHVSYYVTTYYVSVTSVSATSFQSTTIPASDPPSTSTASTSPTLTSTASTAPTLTSTASTAPTLTSTASTAPTLTSTATTAPTLTSTATTAPTLTSTTPTLPTNGGGTELPSPTAALKYVTVGRGIQNYTCSAAGAVPVAIGAVATLYDFTSLAYTSEATLNTVPATIVYTPISAANGSTLTVNGVGTYPMIGQHYFSANGTPTFSLSTVGDILFCTKIATVAAPASANYGPDGTGAVPWLMLSDKGGSVGLSQVYRVVTAGGKAPATCPDTNLISVQYAAEYWFFG